MKNLDQFWIFFKRCHKKDFFEPEHCRKSTVKGVQSSLPTPPLPAFRIRAYKMQFFHTFQLERDPQLTGTVSRQMDGWDGHSE